MRKIEFTRELQHPIEEVWRMLTDSEEMSQWLMPNDFQPVLHHRFQFRTDPAPGFDGIVNCQVTLIEEPTKISYTWRGGGIDTVVTWTLQSTAAGTRLTLLHSGFKLRNAFPRIILGLGWKRIVNKKLLARLRQVTNSAENLKKQKRDMHVLLTR